MENSISVFLRKRKKNTKKSNLNALNKIIYLKLKQLFIFIKVSTF